MEETRTNVRTITHSDGSTEEWWDELDDMLAKYTQNEIKAIRAKEQRMSPEEQRRRKMQADENRKKRMLGLRWGYIGPFEVLSETNDTIPWMPIQFFLPSLRAHTEEPVTTIAVSKFIFRNQKLLEDMGYSFDKGYFYDLRREVIFVALRPKTPCTLQLPPHEDKVEKIKQVLDNIPSDLYTKDELVRKLIVDVSGIPLGIHMLNFIRANAEKFPNISEEEGMYNVTKRAK